MLANYKEPTVDAKWLNLDVPDHLETERLLIRAPQPGDGREFNAAVLASLDGLRTWLGYYRDGPPTLDQSEALMRQKHAEYLLRQDLMLLVFLKGTNTLVASSGMHPDWRVPKFEIGYWRRTGYHGHGYVTEAVRGITQMAFTKLSAERVYIRCDTDNHASANVARRAGFELEATLRREGRKVDGGLRDSFIFAMLRPDYFANYPQ